jgi:regulator of replication initiation timing
MMAGIIKESIINIDPDKINFDDKESVKELIIALLNTIEHLVQENAKLREENQQLRDEIASLKGEKGKPKIRPNVPTREPISPKTKSKVWSKGSKKNEVKVDRQVTISVERPLPPDAHFACYRKVVIQDIVLKPNNIEYLLERYYSPSLNKYYDAKLPNSVRGSQFGANLKSFIAVLYFSCRVTENKIWQLCKDIGISISEGQISNIITKVNHKELASEKQAIFEAGMNHASFVQTDETGARHQGMNYYMHVVCDPNFTCYFIKPDKKRDTLKGIFSLGKEDDLEIPLITDDAKQYYGLSKINCLCWIHEIRHYIKLNPYLGYHKQILESFLAELYEFYRFMQLYKINPNENLKAEVRSKFEELIFRSYGYSELEQRLAVTWRNRDRLLQFLDYPFIPLHNNESEIAAREPVIKRKISYGTRSELGKCAWENVLSIKDTCRKLGVNFFQYMQDIYSNSFSMPRLAEVMTPAYSTH